MVNNNELNITKFAENDPHFAFLFPHFPLPSTLFLTPCCSILSPSIKDN